MTSDGTLSLWQDDKSMVWSASYREICSVENGCVKSHAPYLQIQRDGNIVVYDGTKNVLWSARANTKTNFSLTIYDNGVVRLIGNHNMKTEEVELWTIKPPTPDVSNLQNIS
eukprot:CAMPEP_0194367450 /NCGR_PEP_ID=MMETSP0174-20130528/15530_1 /TAXON_ID=216777 /ORGANISM="Proboscia alata, Strain PI-D3" /LENGTH=111 /DNA_ID=CAMNT_0039143195 /DNA_START=238 /DNA_END=569 /DNA_ORIENTATION=+